jgi:hypothetical protein
VQNQDSGDPLREQLDALCDAHVALIGQVHALKMAFIAVTTAHPYPDAVVEILSAMYEEESSALLLLPIPDESIGTYEETVAELLECVRRSV